MPHGPPYDLLPLAMPAAVDQYAQDPSTATKLLDQETGIGQMLEVTERHGAVDLKHERDVVDGDGTAVREKRHQDGAAGRILDRAQELVEVGTGHAGHTP